MKAIIGGHEVLIDDGDAHVLSSATWRVQVVGSRKYVYSGRRTLLHRLLLGLDGEPREHGVVDHINGNGLDNRRENIRVCRHSENLWNHGRNRHNTSGYKGVYRDKARSQWVAEISFDGKRIHLGRYATAEDAAAAYDRAAVERHGVFANHNNTQAEAV